MKPTDLDSSSFDRRGIVIAFLCFVHCVAGPILLSVAGLASLISISEKLEPLFLLGSAAMGAIALVPSYRKKHRRMSCLAMFGSGLVCLFLRHHIGWRPMVAESVGASAGVILIVGAHILNLRFTRTSRCCERGYEAVGTGANASS